MSLTNQHHLPSPGHAVISCSTPSPHYSGDYGPPHWLPMLALSTNHRPILILCNAYAPV